MRDDLVPMTARELRAALVALPDEILDRPVTWGSEYTLSTVRVEAGGLLFERHVVLDGWA